MQKKRKQGFEKEEKSIREVDWLMNTVLAIMGQCLSSLNYRDQNTHKQQKENTQLNTYRER